MQLDLLIWLSKAWTIGFLVVAIALLILSQRTRKAAEAVGYIELRRRRLWFLGYFLLFAVGVSGQLILVELQAATYNHQPVNLLSVAGSIGLACLGSVLSLLFYGPIYWASIPVRRQEE